eukprot:CAMPEP_0202865050 /NCGR_PEP_ID=MMETSP1391-20130828/5150_1 /ASSEMBLY_ACC=CAM_ASM_000867 /TAXON_ID=1034604 /ORGANISM="Chlamydomonas leiostraca, Strain SAG 11-49" /LENGTH=83 /DNA_ID=CAMNT_0049544839 /DNA_START=124 /DNA_END=375 /DNA_ORIENTATION=+
MESQQQQQCTSQSGAGPMSQPIAVPSPKTRSQACYTQALYLSTSPTDFAFYAADSCKVARPGAQHGGATTSWLSGWTNFLGAH